MFCDMCRDLKPTRFIGQIRCVGAVVVVLRTQYWESLCETCLRSRHHECMATTALLGWWSPTAFFVTPIALALNVLERRRALASDPVPAQTASSQLDAEASRQQIVKDAYGALMRATLGGALFAVGLVFAVCYVAGADLPLVAGTSVVTLVLGAAIVVQGVRRRERMLAAGSAPEGHPRAHDSADGRPPVRRRGRLG